jgi:hypothetical protein
MQSFLRYYISEIDRIENFYQSKLDTFRTETKQLMDFYNRKKDESEAKSEASINNQTSNSIKSIVVEKEVDYKSKESPIPRSQRASVDVSSVQIKKEAIIDEI